MKRSTDAAPFALCALLAAATSVGRAMRARPGWLVVPILLGLITTAAQAQIVVTNNNDTGTGSLREAIVTANANPGSTITFSNAVAGQTITLASELPLILGNTTTIDGGSQNLTISGANTFRVFFIGGAGQAGEPASTTATIENLTIKNANAQGGNGGQLGGGGAGLGGAVFVSSTGALTLSNVSLASNAATGGNGGTGGSNPNAAGGGGGMSGSASPLCCNGGGGGFGQLAAGGAPGGGNGSVGAFTGGASGGPALGALTGGTGGANGGGGGAPLGPGGGGGGGVGGGAGTYNNATNNAAGGNGGFGGGGGAGFTFSGPGGAGGHGGFGGGGGGGGGTDFGPNTGGNGGFGGGGGGAANVNGSGGFGGGDGGGNGGGFGGGGGGGAGLGGALFVQQGGTLTLAGPLVVNGNTVAGGGAIHPGSGFGGGMFLQGNGTVVFQPGIGQTQAFADVIADQTGSGGTGLNAGSWNLTLNGAGTLTLAAGNSYSGSTTIDAGTLLVTGSIAASSGVTVNAGGTLGGTGIVSAISVNSGGTLMPGLPAVVGTLQATSVTFASGASYLITINGTANSKVAASGAATLNSGATVDIASGSTINVGQKYTILIATGGVTGQFNPNVAFGAIKGTLSYDANDVFLTFGFTGIAPLLPQGAPINVVNVANAIDRLFLGGAALPSGFTTVALLPQSQIDNALTQLSGELGTGAQLSAFQLMNEFMSLLLDPLADGHGGGIGPLPFAPSGPQATFTPEVANAYASVLKAPSAPSAPITAYGPWRAWGAAFGGSNNVTGDPIVVGSHDVRTTAGGFAAGLDYRASPDTVIGAALAGATTGWDLSAGLGSGNSDAFQAGFYAKHQMGAAYLAGALAFANHWASTTRTVTVAGTDTLKASFDAQSFGGRLEGGYRVNIALVTLTPYAALQAQSFRLPSYSETAASGSPQFALAYAAQTSTAERGELGAWLSRNLLLARGDTLALFGRAAWAHDWFGNLAVTPSFQALPGASFVVTGAAPPHDLALVTAGAEWRLHSNWSLMGRFDGEFGDGQRTYTGTARVRYAW